MPERMSALLVGALLGSATAASHGEDLLGESCSADLVCVQVVGDVRDTVSLVLTSRTDKPLTFALFLSGGLAHLNPPPLKLQAPGRRQLVTLHRPPPGWGFRYRVHYGHAPRTHDDGYLYRLPYPADQAWPVSQSAERLSTHDAGNRHAIDFSMPVGTPVHAAREGRVVSVFEGSRAHSRFGAATGNHIWIEHPDGTIGKYLHLDRDGAYVEEGQRVKAGELIGRSGNTGYSSGAHLHFSVSSLGGDELYETFDVTFRTSEGPRRLVGGKTYRHPGSG